MCLCEFARWLYSVHVPGNALEFRRLVSVEPSNGIAHCRFEDGGSVDVPGLLGRFLQRQDQLRFLGAPTEVLIDREAGRQRPQFLHTTIGHAGLPKVGRNDQAYVRAELPACSEGPRALYLSGESIRRYFYGIGEAPAQSLYELLRVQETASPDQLRVAWRMRSLELTMGGADSHQFSCVERAFNLLAHPDLRNCYDAMRKDDDALPLFPYGGFGAILVSGHLSKEEDAFFADRILAYKPQTTVRKVNLLLRKCEFLADLAVCRDGRRKVEIWLDSNSAPGLDWDLTWNHWKHWLSSRLAVDATFVTSGKHRLNKGEWTLQTWQVALPSRLRVQMAETLAVDIRHALQIHALLGEHADLVRHIRTKCEKAPVEFSQVQAWFEQAGATCDLKPHHVTWRPDYEPYYFEQLRKRSRTWFLFRDEFLFVWDKVLIAEVPQPGHATYIFAKPADLDHFLNRYAKLSREEIRHNRDNLASALGFVGRVIRGKRRKRWLESVLKLAGTKTDYVEAFD
jgi:hypothetical protein